MKVIELNRNNFKQEVLQSAVPVVVDFWAPWCGPCQAMGPIISKLAEASDGGYTVGKVNVDEEPELAETYGIMSIPSIKVFRDGRNSASAVGYTPQNKILEMLDSK